MIRRMRILILDRPRPSQFALMRLGERKSGDGAPERGRHGLPGRAAGVHARSSPLQCAATKNNLEIVRRLSEERQPDQMTNAILHSHKRGLRDGDLRWAGSSATAQVRVANQLREEGSPSYRVPGPVRRWVHVNPAGIGSALTGADIGNQVFARDHL